MQLSTVLCAVCMCCDVCRMHVLCCVQYTCAVLCAVHMCCVVCSTQLNLAEDVFKMLKHCIISLGHFIAKYF